jgi:hypothetical protein
MVLYMSSEREIKCRVGRRVSNNGLSASHTIKALRERSAYNPLGSKLSKHGFIISDQTLV